MNVAQAICDALVKEGESIQKQTKKVADEKMAAVAGKAAGTWDRLEQVFEDRVARSLSSLGVPTKKDIDKLSKRVAELTVVVQKLTDAQETTPKAAPKTAAKPVGKATKAAPTVAKVTAPKAAPVKKAATPKSAALKKAEAPESPVVPGAAA